MAVISDKQERLKDIRKKRTGYLRMVGFFYKNRIAEKKSASVGNSRPRYFSGD